MSTTILSRQRMALGETRTSAVIASTDEQITLRVAVEETVPTCQARVTIIDRSESEDGKRVSGTVINGSDTHDIRLDRLPSHFSVTVELSVGEAFVGVSQLDAADAAGLPDGSVTEAKLAASSVVAVKLGAASVETAKLAAGAATAPKISLTGIKFIPIAGANASGGAQTVAANGAAVGDRVVAVIGSPLAAATDNNKVDSTTDFATSIAVADEVQQLTTDLSANTYWLILLPAAA